MNTFDTTKKSDRTYITKTDSDVASCLEQATSEALEVYPSLCLIKVELMVPDVKGINHVDDEALVQYERLFEGRINRQRGYLKLDSITRFVWNLSEDKNELTVILNREAYPNITNYSSDISFIANAIETAWARLLYCTLNDLRGMVHYPIHAVSYRQVKP